MKTCGNILFYIMYDNKMYDNKVYDNKIAKEHLSLKKYTNVIKSLNF